MTDNINRIVLYIFSTVFLLATGLYIIFQNDYILLAPVTLAFCLVLLRWPEYLLYALLLSIPWSIEFNFTPELGTDLPDEPLMLLAAAAAIILLIRYRKFISTIHVLVVIVILQLAWTAITVVTSAGLLLSLKYFLSKCWYLLAFVVMPSYLFRDERILKKASVVLLASMLTLMVVTFVRHTKYGWSFEGINYALIPFFRNHVNYSAMLTMMVPILIAIINLAKKRSARRTLWALVFITAVGIYFSYARGAWIALVAGMVTYWLLRKRLLLFSYLLFLLLLTGAILWLRHNDNYLKFSNDFKSTVIHSDFQDHLVATYQLKDASTAERYYRWVAGARMVEDGWRTGFGPSTFYSQYKSYTVPAFKTWVSKNEERSTIHNYFLLLLVEQGLIGLLLFVLLIGSLFYFIEKYFHSSSDHFRRVSLAAIASTLVIICVVNFLSDMIETDKVGSLFYLCIAIVQLSAPRNTNYNTTEHSTHPASHFPED